MGKPIKMTRAELNRAVVKLAGWRYIRQSRYPHHAGWHWGTYTPYEQRADDSPPYRWSSHMPKYVERIELAMELVEDMRRSASIGEWYAIEMPRGNGARVGIAEHDTHTGDEWKFFALHPSICVALCMSYYEWHHGVSVELTDIRKHHENQRRT